MGAEIPSFRLGVWDLALIGFYLLIVVGIGILAGRGHKSESDYLLGGRQMPWFLVVASVIATAFSGISLVGAPGYAFAHDCRLLPGALIGLLALPVTLPIVSAMRQLRLFTVYEFLERRFSFPLRAFASGMFLLTKLAYAGVVIYTPALLLHTATGQPLLLMVLAMGLLATFLSLVGGLKGAVWTDLLQLAVMIAGMGGVFWILIAANRAGDGQMLAVAAEAGRLRMWDFSTDWAAITFWALLVNTLLSSVGATFADQVQMQYFFSTRQRDVVKTFVISQLVGIPLVGGLFFLGVLLFGFYATEGRVLPEDVRLSPDAVMPYFVSTQLPAGLRGLVIAAITAATVSTVVSVLNSLGLATTQDFLGRLRKHPLPPRSELILSRVAVGVWGAAVTGVACFVGKLGSVIETSQVFAGVIGGGLAGIFFLGFFTRRTGATQAILGGVVGTLLSVLAMKYTTLNFLWYFVVGMGGTILVGWGASLWRPAEKHERRNLLDFVERTNEHDK